MAKSKMFAPATIKRFTSIHSWVGICTGMALFIAFFAGALTMYAGPMKQWANPDLRRTSHQMVALDRLVDAVANNPAAKGAFTLSFGDGREPTASFFERGSGRRFRAHTFALDDKAAIVPRRTVSSVEHFINEIHYTIGLPKRPGYTLMGVVSAVYGLALVTGLLIHLPHLVGDLFALRTGKNLKKMWLDAHNAIGILSLPFHLMFAFTGMLICMMFMLGGLVEKASPTGYAAKAYAQSQGERGRVGRQREAAPRGPAADMLPPAQIVAIAAGRLTGFEPTGISYSAYGTRKAQATVTGYFHQALVSTGSIQVSPIDGKIGKIDAPGERNAVRIMEGAYAFLHYGDYGGEVMRAIYFVLGLAGAFLFYSGNLLWIETKRRRRYEEQVMSGWVLAQISIGVCLGCCLGLALTLIGVRLLPPDLIGRADWERNLYYIGFFGAVLWALSRPPIRAGIEILFATAAAYLVLPVLNALLTRDDLFSALAEGLWDVAVIDILMLLLGTSFLLLGQATVRRARNGQPHSVWSLTSRPKTSRSVAGEPASTVASAP